MNVLILGLDTLNNMGEKFIIECTKYILKDAKYDYEVCDFEPKMTLYKKLIYFFLIAVSKTINNIEYSAKIEYLAVIFRCRKIYIQHIKKSDKIVVAAGSIKYSTQHLWAYYCLAINIAEKFNKDIMFDAANIQKYCDADWRCRHLARHLKSKNVKVITTRSGRAGLERIENEYKLPLHQVHGAVGDIAYWLPDLYDIRSVPKTEIVGINLISGNTYIRYGGSISQEKLLDVYTELLLMLETAGIKWELFTNGLPADFEFGKRLIKKVSMNSQIYVPSTARQLAEKIKSYNLIFGARLHACICAYVFDVPVVGMVWDEKMSEFAAVAGISDLFLSEENITAENIFCHIKDLYQNGYSYDVEKRNDYKHRTRKYIIDYLKNTEN